MACLIPDSNLMPKIGFFLLLMVVLLLPTFGATLSADSRNVNTDQLALLALKSHVSHDSRNLLATNWSTSTFICNWIGVTCGSRHRRVTALNLSGMGLTGTIQPHLGNLSFLAWLDISHNSFHGSLPIQLANLHRLKYLDFGNNSFGGEIPSWFGFFAKLQSLCLYGNNFTGVIPSTLGNLSKLENLTLYNNDFKGQIPITVGNLSNLKRLYLDNNSLSGHLSSGIFDNLPKLQVLSLSWNQIFRRIPSSLFKCKELTYLSFYDNFLEGSVPIEIGNLTMLNLLYLSRNHLKGEIPQVIRNLTSLKHLDLFRNNLTGRIPTPPPSLHWFCVSDNNLVGEIPSSICNLSFLKGLYFFKNNLNGTIPECIGNLSSSLLHIIIQKNNFHGKIPENFVEGCTLKSFRISNNQIEGSLPRSLGNCKDLDLLDVGNNYLNDTFPNWLGNLDQLQVLILRSNRFYGHIDNSEVTFSFTRLRAIDLSHNKFSGYLPTKLFENLQVIKDVYKRKVEPEYMIETAVDGLVYYVQGVSFVTKGMELEFHALLTIWMAVDFSNNQFSGEIPKALGDLHSLIVLNLSHNGLTGPIPSSFCALSELESLDLSLNKLEGRIPAHLKNLIFLEVLNLSYNYLVGPIPQGNQFDTFMNDSYKENLGLCGVPVSMSCSNDGKMKPTLKKDSFTKAFTWKFAMLMGYGCGLVFGLSMGYIVFTIGKPWWLVRMFERGQQKYVGGQFRRRGGITYFH